jgi:hypothetical protein
MATRKSAISTKSIRTSAPQPKNILIGDTLMGLDLKDNQTFESTNDIYHSVGRTHRSASEAFKDAEYAQAIWKYRTDTQEAIEFLKDMFVGLAIVGIPFGIIYLFIDGFIIWARGV